MKLKHDQSSWTIATLMEDGVGVYQRIRSIGTAALMTLVRCTSACATKPLLPEWRVALSLEDEISCGQYRTAEIYDSGLVVYTPPGRNTSRKNFQLDEDSVAKIVEVVKSFLLIPAGYAEQFPGIRKREKSRTRASVLTAPMLRGSSADIEKLSEQISKLTGFQWPKIEPAASSSCPDHRYELPAGAINLRDDFK